MPLNFLTMTASPLGWTCHEEELVTKRGRHHLVTQASNEPIVPFRILAQPMDSVEEVRIVKFLLFCDNRLNSQLLENA